MWGGGAWSPSTTIIAAFLSSLSVRLAQDTGLSDNISDSIAVFLPPGRGATECSGQGTNCTEARRSRANGSTFHCAT